jgi:hypothetical protein
MPAAHELAAALLSVAEWCGRPGLGPAAAAVRASENSSGALAGAASGAAAGAGCAIRLAQDEPHRWSTGELELLFTAMMQNTRVTSLSLRRMPLGPPAARALGAVLGRSASLRELELRGCDFDEAALALWAARRRALFALIGSNGLGEGSAKWTHDGGRFSAGRRAG